MVNLIQRGYIITIRGKENARALPYERYKPLACIYCYNTEGEHRLRNGAGPDKRRRELRGGGPAIAANSSGFTSRWGKTGLFLLTTFFELFSTRLLTKMRLRGYNRHVRVKDTMEAPSCPLGRLPNQW